MLVVGFDLDMTLVDSRPGIMATLVALEAETGAPVASDEMLDALLRRNLDLEFGDRFEAELADRVVRPIPRALRGARRARHPSAPRCAASRWLWCGSSAAAASW